MRNKSTLLFLSALNCIALACGPTDLPPLGPPPADSPRPIRTDDCTSLDSTPGFITDLLDVFGAGTGRVTVTDAYVYYTAESFTCSTGGPCTNGYLRRVPRCGGSVEDLGPLVPNALWSPSSVGIGTGGGFVYVLLPNELVRIRESDRTRTSLPISSLCPTDLAVNGTHAFVYDSCTGVLRAAHTDNALSPFIDVPTQQNAGQLTLGTHVLYFQHGTEVRWQDLRSGQLGRLYDAGARIVDLIADDRAVSVVVAADASSQPERYTVRRVPLGTDAPLDLGLALPLDKPGAYLAAEQGQTYFRRLSRHGEPELARTLSDAASAVSVLRRAPQDFSVYGERLYWSESGRLFTARVDPLPTGPDGNVEPTWAKLFDDGAGQSLAPFAFSDPVLFADGSFALLVTHYDPDEPPAMQESQVVLLRFSASGTLVWRKPLAAPAPDGGPGHGRSEIACLGADPSANLTAVVWEYPRVTDPGTPARAMYRFRSDGTLLGVTREPGDGYTGEKCAFDPNGNIYLLRAGHWLTKKAADARTLWQTRVFPDAGGGGTYAIRASASGVVLAGTHPIERETAFAARVRADGSVAWTRSVTGFSGITSVAFGADERVVATGSIRDGVDFGMGRIPSPYGAQDVTLLLQLGSDGAVQSHRFIDIAEPSDVMAQSDGTVDLLIGTWRTGSFGAAGAPGNVVSGVTMAKLGPTGELVFSRNLSPAIERELAAANLVPHVEPPGTRAPDLHFGRLASGASGTLVVGGVRMPDECGPNRSNCQLFRGFTALYAR